jgi:hypothetical protein
VFDHDALPRTAAYVDGLPHGLDSYPRCRVRTEVTRVIIERFPQLLDQRGMHPMFVDQLREMIREGEWLSEAVGTAVRLLTRDAIFEDDAQYYAWTFEISSELFARPVFRALMYVVSPTLVMLGASRRWSAFREGTTLVAKPRGNGGDITLTFPPHLYTPFVLEGFGHAFRASLAAARARDVRIELREALPERASWSVTWV